jgi:hypothetical protein
MLPAKLTPKTALRGLTAGVVLSSLVAVLIPGPVEMLFLWTAGVLVVLSVWTARCITVFRHQRTPMAWFWGVLTAIWWLVVAASVLHAVTTMNSDRHTALLMGVVLGGFVVVAAGFFSVGFFVRALTQSQLERRALAQDQADGLVVLPANRALEAPARRAPRALNVLAVFGVVGLVGWPVFGIVVALLDGNGRVGMSVGAWLVIVAGGRRFTAQVQRVLASTRCLVQPLGGDPRRDLALDGVLAVGVLGGVVALGFGQPLDFGRCVYALGAGLVVPRPVDALPFGAPPLGALLENRRLSCSPPTHPLVHALGPWQTLGVGQRIGPVQSAGRSSGE